MIDAEVFLRLISGAETAGSFIELRYQPPDERSSCWPSRWYDVTEVEVAAAFAIDAGQHLNIYAGTAPRTCRRGRAADVAHGWLVSADADTDAALDRLARFPLAPTMTIESGGRTASGRAKRHAHWQLVDALGRSELGALKARLADALDSDRHVASPDETADAAAFFGDEALDRIVRYRSAHERSLARALDALARLTA